MRKLSIILCALFIVSVQMAFAQNISITGTIKAGGDVLPGTSVLLKGTGTGTIADVDGHYAIEAPANGTLVFSFVGMISQEIPIQGRKVINVELKDESVNINEVVVVAYGVAKKSTFTGSAVTVKADVLEKRQTSSISQSLQGVAPGVQVTMNSGQPGENAQIRIRGISSLNTGSEPLWVIDGIPYEGNLNSVNPDDIESMTILKDAASAALYGARGANGVVMVTTKKGRKDQAPTISLKAVVGTSNRAVSEYKKLHTVDWMQMQWEAMRNGSIGSSTLGGLSPEQWATDNLIKNIVYNPIYQNGKAVDKPIGTDGKVLPGTTVMWDEDWYDAVTQTPIRQEYQLSISGGANKVRYAASLGYLKDEGTTRESYFTRYNGRLSLEADITKWLSTGLSAAFSYSDQNYPPQAYENIGYPYVFSRVVAPIYPVYKRNEDGSVMKDQNGKPVFDLGDGNPKRPVASGQNPRASLGLNTKKYTKTTLAPNWWFQLNIIDGLTFKNSLAINTWHGDDDQIYSRVYADAKGLGYQYKYRNNQMVINANQVLSYSKQLGDHNIGLMLGHESSKNTRKYLSAQKSGTYSDDFPEFSMSTTMVNLNSYTEELNREGYFGRASYDYKSKYFVEASYRRDASSRFYIDNAWGNFWSVAGAWNIMKEGFMKDISFLSNLRIRASYGVNGTLPSDNYGYMSLISYTNKYMGNPGGTITTVANSKLTWETSYNTNIGIDFGFWGQRLRGTVEYFNRNSKNLLQDVPISTVTGFSSTLQNVGCINNHGLEVELNGDIIDRDGWLWSAGVNATFLRSEVKELYGGADIIWYDPTSSDSRAQYVYREGESTLAFYGYEWAGVDKSNGKNVYYVNDPKDAKAGDFEYNGRGATYDYDNANFSVIGNAIPKVYGGINTSVSYKGIALSLGFTYKIGGDLYDGAYMDVADDGYYWERIRAKSYYDNLWTPENTSGSQPRIEGLDLTDPQQYSSRHLFDASYLRLKSLTLAYTLPKTLTRKAFIENARFFFNAGNLWTIAKYKEADPEVSEYGTRGWETPIGKTFVLGVELKF